MIFPVSLPVCGDVTSVSAGVTVPKEVGKPKPARKNMDAINKRRMGSDWLPPHSHLRDVHHSRDASSIIVSHQMPNIMSVKETLPMIQKVFRVSAILILGIVSGLIGWVIGALIGGSYAEQFVFNSVRGYEATGQIGFILGSLIGLFSSWQLLMKKKS
jgi:hypothetical protein